MDLYISISPHTPSWRSDYLIKHRDKFIPRCVYGTFTVVTESEALPTEPTRSVDCCCEVATDRCLHITLFFC
jgi:hypothetical protein